jgi:hypothetical protein
MKKTKKNLHLKRKTTKRTEALYAAVGDSALSEPLKPKQQSESGWTYSPER